MEARGSRASLSLLGVALTLFCSRVDAAGCLGDCTGDLHVQTDELVRCVNIALHGDREACAACNRDENPTIGVHELIASVSNALNGCPADLVATKVSLRVEPTGGCTAEPRALVVCAANVGMADAGPFSLSVNGEQFGRTGGLVAGEERCVEGLLVEGRLEVEVDSSDEVREDDESNNARVFAVETPTPLATCTATTRPSATNTETPSDTPTRMTTPTATPTPDLPDLIPIDLLVEAPTPEGGCINDPSEIPPKNLVVIVDNRGPAGSSSFGVAIDDESFARDEDGIPPGGRALLRGRFMNGDLQVVVDPDGEVEESDESNNDAGFFVPFFTPPPQCTATPTATGTRTPTLTASSTSSSTPSATPTPTATVTPTTAQRCPLDEGQYTLTQTEGGELTISTIPTFPFPAGGTIVMDVGPATFPECKHPVTIHSPGGFNSPLFCIVALGFSVRLEQTGCGTGELDSNGGSDYTIREIGDTSDASSVCNLPQACAAAQDSSVRVDITVGDGEVDQCTSGNANLIMSIPVFTTTWSRIGFPCPDQDGRYDPGTDSLIVSFPQMLDFTSDTALADFADVDGDGCCIAGAGPATGTIVNCAEGGAGPLTGAGTCIDLDDGLVTTAASGPVGSRGAPLYDLTFVTVLPNTFERTGERGDSSCDHPPLLPLGASSGSTASRCITQ